MPNPHPPPIKPEDAARGRETQRRNREERRRRLETGLDDRDALETAMDRLVQIAQGPDESAALGAVKEIVHQLAGKPAQKIEHGDGDGGPVRIVVQSAFSDPKQEPSG